MRKNQGRRRHEEPTNAVKGEMDNFDIFLLRWERLQQVDMLGVGHFLGGRSQERREAPMEFSWHPHLALRPPLRGNL